MIMAHFILLAILKMVFPAGTAAEPSAVAPLAPTTEALSFWWDDASFHAGEKSFSWRELGTAPTNGATFKVDFGVVDGVLDRRRIVLEGRIDRAASRYRLGSFGPIGETAVSNEVTVVAAKTGEIKNRFQAAGPAPDYIEVRGARKAKPGETVSFKVTGNGSKSGWCNDVLWDADGTELYVADGPYRSAGRKFDYGYLWTDTGTENAHFVAYVWTDAKNESIRITAEDLASGRKVRCWETKVTVAPAWGKQQYDFSVANLPAGTFKLVFDYLDGAGKVLHSDFARYYKPYGKAPWEGNTLGLEDTVPPPWTKPEFADDGTFRCWGRTIRLGGKGLVTSMVSQGKELLAEPVAILLDGKALSFRVTDVTRKVSEATYRLTAVDAAVEATVRCEFDGYLRFELEYPAGIDRLEWKVAGNRRLFTVFDDCSGDKNKDILAKTGAFVRDFDIGKKPWWWMTGRVGVMGGVINLRGTHLADLGKSGAVEVTDDRVTVMTRFVDSPLAAGPRRRVRFYLEPTPVKPKDMDFDCLEQKYIRLWTGYMTEYYEVKAPGYELWDRFEKFRQEVNAGVRVFFYNAFNGVSPESPFWGRYGWEWTKNDISYYAKEVPLYGEMRKTNNWGYGCPNSRNFLEWKIWGFNWMLNEPVKEMKDLYFDLAEPATSCRNASHGCVWTDDFGRPASDGTFEAIRELAKRSYRLVKAKNEDGMIYGHVNKIRTPCDSFFGFNGVGESLDVEMYKNGRTYYDVFTPEMMQALWIPKAQEFSLYVTPQFERTLWRFVGEKAYREYNPDVPELRTPIRHFLAYVKLHALNIYFSGQTLKEGKFYVPVDNAVKGTGPNRAYSAYYLENPTVSLSKSMPRFLWGHFAGDGRQVLILLNDTDETVTQTVTVKGLAMKGREILDGTPFDFTSGSCTITFGPREAKFLEFKGRAYGISRAAEPHKVRGNGWWAKRFAERRRQIAASGGKIDLVFLGDSISHFWETPRGTNVLAKLAKDQSVLVAGYAGDRSRNLLWRCQNGELDGYEAGTVSIMIGTNDCGNRYDVEDTVETIAAIVAEVKARQPKAKILLCPIFPRAHGSGVVGRDPSHLYNQKVNERIRPIADGRQVVWFDIGERFVSPDGTISKKIMDDYLHPTQAGYEIWYKELLKVLPSVSCEN